ncbi:MAG: type III secretion protein, partial [Nitrospirae bacterium]
MKVDFIGTDELITFLVVLLRLSMIMVLLPVFGSKMLPPLFKVGLIIALSLSLTPVVQITYSDTGPVITLIREVVFSSVLAFTVRFIFYAIDTAGQVISTATGLAMANVFNPELGQSTEIARIYGIVAILLFLAMNGHHYFIYAFIRSFEYIPFGGAGISGLIKEAIRMSGRVFTISVQIAAPFITVVMVVNILLGIVSKLIPQFNVFFVG